MNNNARRRLVMSIVLPLILLVTVVSFVGSMATLLLFNTRAGSLMLAAVAAAGILSMISLSASQDRLGGPRRGVVIFAVALPMIVGAGIGFGLIGDVEDEDRMINAQPLVTMPEGAPVIAAENASEFCLPQNGDCEPLDRWEVSPGAVTDTVSFTFENRDEGVDHNVVIYTLDNPDDPARGETLVGPSTLIAGVTSSDFVDPAGTTWEELPEEWYFDCQVHPNMNGIGTVVAEG